jgi:hypothetical protein
LNALLAVLQRICSTVVFPARFCMHGGRITFTETLHP